MSSQKANLEKVIDNYFKDSTPRNLETVMEAGEALIQFFAQNFSGSSTREDLIQAGYEGLLKTVHKFDPQRGVKFITYASHCIMGQMRWEIQKEKRFDRPAWVISLQNKIFQVTEELIKKTGQPPTIKEIAEVINIKEEGIAQALQAGSVSLEELSLSEIKSLRTETFRLPIEDKITLIQAIKKLNEVQRKVVYFLFFKDMTQEETAAVLNTNQRQVSRLLQKSLTALRRVL